LKTFSQNTEQSFQKKILTDKFTQKPRGLGFVEFSTRAEAQAAVDDAANLYIDGRQAEVSFSDQKPERTGPSDVGMRGGRGGDRGGRGGYGGDRPQRSNFDGERFSAFVGNLGFKSSEASVRSFFSACGNVIDVRIAKSEDGKSRGFCHVDFDSATALESAKGLAGQNLDGREIRVDASTPRTGGGDRGGFRGGRGGDRGGRGGFRGGRGGFAPNPMKSGSMGAASKNAVMTFDDDE